MLKITNGKEIIEVTKGAYEEIYKPLGFTTFESKEVKEVVEEKEEVSDITEKPISQWSKKELVAFSEEKEIDLGEAKKAEDIREVVKEYLETVNVDEDPVGHQGDEWEDEEIVEE